MTGKMIIGDWGTTSLKLFLCTADGTTTDSRTGPGVKDCPDPEAALFDTAGDWLDEPTTAPIVLTGMAGSTLGLHPAPYVPCPADPGDIARHAVQMTARDRLIHILPGLSCTGPHNLPEVMRGEEVQILGWRTITDHASSLVCLPGTHTKWAQVRDGTVQHFLTGFTGELFELLCRQSVLILPSAARVADAREFEAGVRVMRDRPDLDLSHALFSVRSRQLADTLSADTAHAFLSGILIGADCRGALSLPDTDKSESIALIGAPALTQAYQTALGLFGRDSTRTDATEATLAGCRAVLPFLSGGSSS